MLKTSSLSSPRHPLLLLAVSALVSNTLAQTPPDEILLKDYRPRSIFKIPETRIEKARYPVIDVHSHDYARTEAEVERWVQTMDAVGLEKVIVLSGYTGARFDAALAKFGKHPKRFVLRCGIDYSGLQDGSFGPAALAELERCHKAGATGVGELSDKGRGLGSTSNTFGIHIDDPRLDAILEKCADLRMPVNIHVGEDKWMYESMDAGNDGLMNAWKWRVTNAPGLLPQVPLANARLRPAGWSAAEALPRERGEASPGQLNGSQAGIPSRQAVLKTPAVQTLRDRRASENHAMRLECGAFTAAFWGHGMGQENRPLPHGVFARLDLPDIRSENRRRMTAVPFPDRLCNATA